MPKVNKMSLRPLRMWIDGTSYHIRHPKQPQEKSLEEFASQHLESFQISSDENGHFTTSFRLPSYFYKKIQTYPEFSIESFQKNTNTTLIVPNHMKPGNISIKGDDAGIVAKAREELHTILGDIRSRSTPSQFIAIPTINDEIKNNFIKFKEDILGFDVKIKDVDENIFIKPEKLHITVLVLSLFDDTEIDKAVKVLNDLKNDVLCKLLDGKQLKIHLKGLECMNGNQKKCNVLYSKVEFEDFDLQNLVDKIFDYFHEKGFAKENRGQVKLHVTLMNTKYRTQKKNRNWNRNRIPFDATEIIAKYKDLDLGVCEFNSIHLSLMSSQGEDGFYKSLAKLEI